MFFLNEFQGCLREHMIFQFNLYHKNSLQYVSSNELSDNLIRQMICHIVEICKFLSRFVKWFEYKNDLSQREHLYGFSPDVFLSED
jgi:hypothetical protein